MGSAVGAPLGGFITDSFGWRFCFYINLPFLLVTFYVAGYVLTNYNIKERADKTTFWQRLKLIDFAGAVTIVGATVAFVLAASLGGNILPWTDPLVLSCFAASTVLVVIFALVEARVALYPLMPWAVVTSRTPLACSLTNFWLMMCSMASTYTIPLYLQVCHHAAWRLLFMTP